MKHLEKCKLQKLHFSICSQNFKKSKGGNNSCI